MCVCVCVCMCVCMCVCVCVCYNKTTIFILSYFPAFLYVLQRQVLIEAFNRTVAAFYDCKSVEKVKKETCTG